MLFYFLYKSDIWVDVPSGKRNVRFLFIVFPIYVILHILLGEYSFWMLMLDLTACSVIYTQILYGIKNIPSENIPF